MKDGKIYPIMFIAVLSLLCAGLLTATNESLKGKIQANQEATMRSAVVCSLGLFDDSKNVNNLSWDKVKESAKIFETQVSIDPKSVKDAPVFIGKDANGKIVGYAALFDVQGKVDKIKGVVALDADKTKVLGIRVYEQKETPSYGGKAFDKAGQWCAKFKDLEVAKGKDLGKFIKFTGSKLKNGVDAIATATITMQRLDIGFQDATKLIVTGKPPVKAINIVKLGLEDGRKVAAVCAFGLAKDPEKKSQVAKYLEIYKNQITAEKKSDQTIFTAKSVDGKLIGRGIEFSGNGNYGRPFKGVIAFNPASTKVLGLRFFDLNEYEKDEDKGEKYISHGSAVANPSVGWYFKFAGKNVFRKKKGKPGRFVDVDKKYAGNPDYVDAATGATHTSTKVDKALTRYTKKFLKLFPAKKPEPKKTEVKKPEVKKPEVKKPEVKKPEVKKPEPTAPKKGNVKIDSTYDYTKEVKDWSKATNPYPGKRPKNKLPIQDKKYTPPAITAPAGVTNVALGKKVTSNASKDMDEFFGTDDKNIFDQLTDGKFECKDDKAGLPLENWYVEDEGTQPYFQVDLEKKYELYGIGVWHFYYRPRWFNDVIVLASNDPKFEKDVHILWSNDADNTVGYGKGTDPYFPTAWYGHVIDITKRLNAHIKNKTGFAAAKGKALTAPANNQLVARYIRIYTGQGFTEAPTNLIEIAAWGRPVGAKTPATKTTAPAKKETPKKVTKPTPTKVVTKPVVKKEQPKVSGDMVKFTLKCPKKLAVKTPKPVKWKQVEKRQAVKAGTLMLPKGCKNVALNKTVTSSIPEDDEPVMGEVDYLTDGNKVGDDDSVLVMDVGSQWIQIDLGQPCKIYGIALWHYHQQVRIYKGVVIQIADDAAFTKNVRTVFNNDCDNINKLGKGKDLRYYDNQYGKAFPVKGEVARYVRFYSAGNSSNDDNHYIEAEVFGIPVKANKTPVTKVAPKSAARTSNSKELVKFTPKCPKKLAVKTPKPVKWKQVEKRQAVKAGTLMLPKGCTNIALNKTVTSSIPEDDEPVMGEVDYLTDGNKVGDDDSVLVMDVGSQWIQIDLGKESTIYGIALWHYHQQTRIYKGVVIQIADDAAFTKNVRTIFNNDCDNINKLGKGKDLRYYDNRFGKVFPVKGEKARYIRFYSAGNSSNDDNHYVEAEVYGFEGK